MSFCSFAKDGDENSFVTVESKFITKYLPEADGFAVKVYLYGLYLCKNANADFGIASMAEVLKTTEENIVSAFAFWEDYDLVEIISRSPFAVQYLPVKAAAGKPKKAHYEQYADFNKELQRQMQKVGKFVSANDYVKYMRFLEESAMQPQALSLIAEYCINKQGENVSHAYIFNKAKKLLREGVSTYEQVEKELSGYNASEGHLTAIFAVLSGSGYGSYAKAPTENDYSAYRKWTQTLGFEQNAILTAAKHLKRGTMNSLEMLLEELYEKGKLDAKEIEGYLTEREALVSLTFRIARKLGVKVSNPAAYVDEYVEKWFTYGYEDSSLLDIALFCLKTDRGSFDGMHAIVEKLFSLGVVSTEHVKAFLKQKNEELKLLSKIAEICGTIRKNATNLSLIRTWREWNFSDEMVLEAAKRSASSANPIPYMNKILSDWKFAGVFAVKDIPENVGEKPAFTAKTGYVNPSVEQANAKADRERYYAQIREKEQSRVDALLATANKNAAFKDVSIALSQMELDIAKAEVRSPEKVDGLQAKRKDLLKERARILQTLGIAESDLKVNYTCPICKDSGFLKNGKPCSCYPHK